MYITVNIRADIIKTVIGALNDERHRFYLPELDELIKAFESGLADASRPKIQVDCSSCGEWSGQWF